MSDTSIVRYCFEGKRYNTCKLMCDAIAKRFGVGEKSYSWQVLDMNREVVMRLDGKVIFRRGYTEQGNNRIVNEATL